MTITVAALYDDSKTSKLKQDRPSQLEIHKYKITIDEEENYLTLVGETHRYNKRESELAERLVNEHDNIASEGSSSSKLSLGDYIYALSLAISSYPYTLYYVWGSGRNYDSITDIAVKKGYKVYNIDENPFEHMSPAERSLLLGDSTRSFIIAPLGYFHGYKETPFIAIDSPPFKEFMIDERDPIIANAIIAILREDDVDDLLANIGRSHLSGVVENLSNQAEIKEVK